MKTIGILGGMTPESTVTYYETIIREYERLRGDYAFPQIIVYSVSFQKIVDLMNAGDWTGIESILKNKIDSLSAAGADMIVIATNTMHLLYDELQRHSPLPILSIIDAVAEIILEDDINTAGLLGTKFTMGKTFYQEGLARHGIQTLTPSSAQQEEINTIIFNELGKGLFTEESRRRYLEIIDDLHEKGAAGIVLGCTEIPLLIKPEHTSLPLYDTAAIHARKALVSALEG